MFLVARTRVAQPESVIATLRADIRALDRNLPIASVRTAEQLLGETLSARRFSLVLVSFFGISALALAVVGLYGALAFAVAQRAREIGIRIAIGASNRDVVRLMVWQGMWPVVLGLALGLTGAAGATRVLASTLFEIRPADPATLGGAAVVLMIAALAAVVIPARRAARVDPVTALQ